MRVASCVVCGERLNVLQEKLVTAQWVDAASGALVEMQFHSPCFVRWYQESAASRPVAPEAPGTRTAPPGAAAPPPAASETPAGQSGAPPAAGPPPEEYLSPAERARLQELRGRLEQRGAGTARGPERSDGQGSGRAGDGQQVEDDQQRVHEDDQPPQNE
jgi:hypothetical protein